MTPQTRQFPPQFLEQELEIARTEASVANLAAQAKEAKEAKAKAWFYRSLALLAFVLALEVLL
ncbi:TPA: hypothetical protein UOJ25_000202 [Stenotrophomonas maltophilia]|nr:hypothetical protein [Stenotrophomonas maltophilia]